MSRAAPLAAIGVALPLAGCGSEGTFLGAFDYCEHRWRFDRPG